MDEINIPAGTFLDETNHNRRCPCVLLLDTSASMSGSPIELLNRALPTFRQELLEDPTAKKSVELAVITFGGTPAVIQHWTDVEGMVTPVLTTNGTTPLGPAMQMAVDMIEARRALYVQKAISSFVPWMFILTDGQPDSGPELTTAIQRVTSLREAAPGGKAPKLVVFACSTDPDPAITGRLKAITPKVFELHNMAFRELFVWLSASLKSVSRANPSAPIRLPEPPSQQMTLSEALTIPSA
jgi:uncharacterized protein YegL